MNSTALFGSQCVLLIKNKNKNIQACKAITWIVIKCDGKTHNVLGVIKM